MLVALVIVGQALGAMRSADNAWYTSAFQAFAAESHGNADQMHNLLQMWADHERDPATLGLVQDAMEKKTTGFLQSAKSADVDLPFPNAEKEAAQLDATQAESTPAASQLSLSTTAAIPETAASAPWTPPKMTEDTSVSAPWTPPKMADNTPEMSLSSASSTTEKTDDNVAPWTPPGQTAPAAPQVKSSITPYTAPGGKKDDNQELAAIQQENPEAYGIVKALLLKQQMGLPLPGSNHQKANNQEASLASTSMDTSTGEDSSAVSESLPPAHSGHIMNMFAWKPADSAADDAAVASVLSTVQSGSTSSQAAAPAQADDMSNPFDSVPKVASTSYPSFDTPSDTPSSAPASSAPSTGKNALDAFLR